MTYKIKLKAGFFKTQPYSLIISQGQIILTPQEDSGNGRLVIGKNDLRSVCLIKKDLGSGEFEIVTHSGIYIGSFAPQTDLEEVRHALAKEFGKKVILQ